VAGVVVVVEVDVVGERKNRPTSLNRGEGLVAGCLHVVERVCRGEEKGGGSGVLVVEPTSLDRGRGSWSAYCVRLRGKGGVEEERWWRNERG
jgi:hypothetical protein